MSGGQIGPGRLVAVVGPSGSGKDSIIRGAMGALAGQQVFFARRVITREADLHEDHVPISPAAFRVMEADGAFAFAWEAHGLSYGVPREVDDMLLDGATVILNVSRAIVPLLRERYAHLTIAAVSVDQQHLAQRLTGRGRETQDEIVQRLARAPQHALIGPDVVHINNNGSLEDAVACFLSAVEQG